MKPEIKPYKRRKLKMAEPVMVYRNLWRGGYSLLQNGKVVAHATHVTLNGAQFVVRKGGHARYLKTKRRNVHAFVKGMVDPETRSPDDGGRVLYDISRGRFIGLHKGRAFRLQSARAVTLSEAGVVARRWC